MSPYSFAPPDRSGFAFIVYEYRGLRWLCQAFCLRTLHTYAYMIKQKEAIIASFA
jgi:hypothetical protein